MKVFRLAGVGAGLLMLAGCAAPALGTPSHAASGVLVVGTPSHAAGPHKAATTAAPKVNAAATVCPADPAERAGVILEHANGKQSLVQWLNRHPMQYASNIFSLTITCGGPGGQGWSQKRQLIWIDAAIRHPKALMPAGMVFYAAKGPFGSP